LDRRVDLGEAAIQKRRGPATRSLRDSAGIGRIEEAGFDPGASRPRRKGGPGRGLDASLDQLGAEEAALFDKYNRAYRERFGFPFVICARQNKKEAMLAGFARRLKNSPQQEIEVALAEVFKIAKLRLDDLLVS
jgi:hypothetical protein